MHTTTFDLIYTTIVSSWILIFCQRINTRSGWLKTVYIFAEEYIILSITSELAELQCETPRRRGAVVM